MSKESKELDDITENSVTAGNAEMNRFAESAETTDTIDADIYTYDADDEPVNDRDFYKDYTGEVFEKPRMEPSPDPVSGSDVAVPDKVKTAPIIPETSAENAVVNNDDGEEDVQPASNHIKFNKIYFVNTVISMITLCLTAAAVFTGYAYIHSLEQQLGLERNRISDLEEKHGESGENGGTPADAEFVDAISLIDEEEMNEPATPVSDTVEIDRGKILTYDSYVGYSWFPVLAGIKTNQFDNKNFRKNSEGRMEYYADGELSSYFGIDVSSFQGDINWDAVRSDGVEFAILRIGVRGYAPEGNIKLDDKFIQNYDGAHKAGIDVGVYFYSQAISVEEAIEEAEFVLEQLDGRTLEYPVVFDWEPVDSYDPEVPPRTEDVMPGTLTLSAAAFCEKIKDAGYEAMVYTNKKMAYIKYDLRILESYPKWLALYTDEMTYYYDFDMWQYGFGAVDGIEGEVDLDIAVIR